MCEIKSHLFRAPGANFQGEFRFFGGCDNSQAAKAIQNAKVLSIAMSENICKIIADKPCSQVGIGGTWQSTGYPYDKNLMFVNKVDITSSPTILIYTPDQQIEYKVQNLTWELDSNKKQLIFTPDTSKELRILGSDNADKVVPFDVTNLQGVLGKDVPLKFSFKDGKLYTETFIFFIKVIYSLLIFFYISNLW